METFIQTLTILQPFWPCVALIILIALIKLIDMLLP